MDDDDLLTEILLRLPPRPSSLPRASLVCTRWRRLLTSPAFLRRFLAHHRRRRTKPPLLGVFSSDLHLPDGVPSFRVLHTSLTIGPPPSFTPIPSPPDQIPSSRFSLAPLRADGRRFSGCRHGLLLFLNHTDLEATVLDPLSAAGGADLQRRVPFPPGFSTVRNAAVLRGGGGGGHAAAAGGGLEFKVVLLRSDDVLMMPHGDRVFATVYDSETGVWSDAVSTPVAATLLSSWPSVMAGNSLYWVLDGNGQRGILEFDLDRNSLAVVEHPVDDNGTKYSSVQILRTEDSRLGLATLMEASTDVQIWERKANSDGVAGWTLQKTFELESLLTLRSPMTGKTEHPVLGGYDEDGDLLFVTTAIGVFMIHLKSMLFRSIFGFNLINDVYHPYRSFYTTGMGISSEDGASEDGAETINNG